MNARHASASVTSAKHSLPMFQYQGVPSKEPQDERDPPSLELRPTSNSRLWKAICSILTLIVVAETTALLLGASKSIGYPTQKKTPVPQLPYQDFVFVDDQGFRNLFSPEAVKSSWNKLIKNKEHAGFIHVPNPITYNLLPNTNVVPGVSNAYMVSFHHQLHCLRDLQIQYIDLATALNRSVTSLVDLHHAEHCFNYIRQGIMCAGDTTLEGPDPEPEAGESPLRGWAVKHWCRDWSGLMAWMEENAAVGKRHGRRSP